MIPCRNLILFVEDEALLHVDVEHALETAGFCVAGVLSPGEAAEVLATRPEEICALVTDVDLGHDISGWTLARRARALIPGVPVIYATGGGGADFLTECVAGGRLVSKPYAPEHLVQIARAMLTEPMQAATPSLDAARPGGKGDPDRYTGGALHADAAGDLRHE